MLFARRMPYRKMRTGSHPSLAYTIHVVPRRTPCPAPGTPGPATTGNNPLTYRAPAPTIRFMIRLIPATLALLVVFPAVAATAQTVALHDEATIRFATIEEGRVVLGTRDDWVASFGPFDRQVRMRTREPVTNEQFLEFAAGEALAWSDDEMTKFTGVVESVGAKLDGLGIRLDLPAETLFIKTTGVEEGGNANYTRANAVIIPQRQAARPADELEDVVLHELFHIMSRHNPSIRPPLYRIIGFQPCDEMEYPKALIPRKITNPDAFHFDTFIQVTVGTRRILGMLLTLSNKSVYTGGGLFDYVAIEMLEITVENGVPTPVTTDGQPVLHEMTTVRNFWEQIGANSRYIVHPEEIIADNFVLAVGGKKVANAEILKAVLEILATQGP